jgi:hypothetical protein
MLLRHRDDQSVDHRGRDLNQRLFVAWQDPDSRAIRPVGILNLREANGGMTYEFRYVRGALQPPFRPFVEFPDLERVYTSDSLFAMFENRVMPTGRPDYVEYLEALELPADAPPFEVLAASFGIRATDTVEVFREPIVDPATGRAVCRFLARGVRYVEGAEDMIGKLSKGDRLLLVPEPENPADPQALRLETLGGEPVGYAPAYLASFLHRAADIAGGFDGIEVLVDGCDPNAPFHLRLLCRLSAPMPAGGFVDESLEPLA